ncbi:hypothetical protein TOPH_03372 [Tolypocladium ophioglossoides CBS 100239]|uniref:Uncharacterized protein n=1 Tax=Tolypocladium ophioglossoides (strain CBS 100239) TaxID=1163406 RepID=A0A0L0ND26_TOLOC|nr:hypothetical protein TOPH_03372 [Tolypocladium ophioglossoides CBS 100239]
MAVLNALGLRSWCAPISQYWILSTVMLSQQLYVSALLYIDEVLSHKNLEAIQAVLCCAMYSLRSPTGPSIWLVFITMLVPELLFISNTGICLDWHYASALSWGTTEVSIGFIQLIQMLFGWSYAREYFGALTR